MMTRKADFDVVPKKLVIGVRTPKKMYRLQSNWGSIVDSIRSTVGERLFTHTSHHHDGSRVELSNKDEQRFLVFTPHDFVYRKSAYYSTAALNLDKAFDEFIEIWDAFDSLVSFVDVERIGIVGESRISLNKKNSSEFLFDVLGKPVPVNPYGFILKYQSKRSVTGDIRSSDPDIESDSYLNLIYEYYDSSQDDDFPEDNAVNVNLDVQRYFRPLISRGVKSAIKAHFKIFRSEFKLHKANVRTNSVFKE